jgi:hypothetical protein
MLKSRSLETAVSAGFTVLALSKYATVLIFLTNTMHWRFLPPTFILMIFLCMLKLFECLKFPLSTPHNNEKDKSKVS